MARSTGDQVYRQRHYRCITPRGWRRPAPTIPADVVILDRDPSPCFLCEVREGCRHRGER